MAELEKLDLSVEKIEQVYESFDAMGIQIVGAELDLDLEPDLGPVDLTDEEDELVLDDSYAQALVNYALYRATSKESDYAPGAQNASAWYQSYLGEIQQNTQARGQATPSSALMPGQAVNANGGTE